VIQDILVNYEKASRQKVDFDKTSIMFLKGVPQARREDIIGVLELNEPLFTTSISASPHSLAERKRNHFFI